MSKNNTIRKTLTKNAVDVAQALTSLKHPGEVIVPASLASWKQVGEGNIIRLVVGVDTYVIFDDDGTNSTLASATASPALYLAAGEHYVLCQAEYIKLSAAPTRAELHRI